MDVQPPPRADLRGVLAALRRRRWIIVTTAALALAAGLTMVLLAEPVYEAQAQLLVEPDVAETEPDTSGRVFFLEQELFTQQQLVTSVLVRQRALEALGRSDATAGTVEAAVLPNTRIILVTGRENHPGRAADLVRATVEEYLALRREDATTRLTAGRAEVARQVERLEDELAVVDERLAAQDGFDPAATAERQSLVELLSSTSARLAEIDAAMEAQTGGGRIIQPAEVPTRPVEPAPVRTGAIALLLGLALGVVLALVRDAVDEAVRTDEDVTAATAGRPILGRVPRGADDTGGVVLLLDPDAPQAEAFRDLRTNLRFVASDVRSVALTSSIEEEGKSSVAANLAVAAAMAGFDVALVDADLRRPAVHRLFGLPNGVGTSELLAGTVDLEEVVTPVGDPPVHVVTAGRLPPNPSELLGSQRAADVMEALSKRHDLVIVDTPPALAASDALEVASMADVTVLVVEHERAGRRALDESVRRLERAGGRVVGAVINRVPQRDLDYGYYPSSAR